MTGQLVLAGTGIGGPQRMTLEVHDRLQKAALIFHLTHLHRHLTETYAGAIMDLGPVYHGASSKSEAYQAITETLVTATKAAEPGAQVIFLTYGHPLFLVNSSRDMQAQIPTEVLPAISSFDTLLVDSPVPLGDGAQLFETTKFVALGQIPDAYEPVVLFQFGDYASRDTKGTPNLLRLELLKQQLLRHYPADHPLYVIVSAWDDSVGLTIVALTLSTLAARPDAVLPGATLVMPAAKRIA